MGSRDQVLPSEPAWNLDVVLKLLCSNVFNINVSREFLTMKTMFLLGLALGNRASELHSIIRSNSFIIFSRNKKSVKILPNPTFLAKNEAPSFRRKPVIIKALLKGMDPTMLSARSRVCFCI